MSNKRQAPGTTDAGIDFHVLGRLELVLREEIEALENHQFDQLSAFTTRKALCLLEMTRAQQREVGAEIRTSLEPRLAMLRRHIALDQRLLATHLRAAGDVAALLARALSKDGDDGTYSAAAVRAAAP